MINIFLKGIQMFVLQINRQKKKYNFKIINIQL